MTVRNLGYLGFAVSDPKAWDSFATNVLGVMPVAGPNPEGRHYRVDSQSWRICAEPGDKNDISYLGFEVSGPQELSEISDRLRKAGVKLWNNDHHLAQRRGVINLISCHDPEGLPIEIYYGALQATENPFASSSGVTGFVTGEQGIGHVVLATADIEKSRKFYTEALGMQLSDVISMRVGPELTLDLEFFHCNARHHTLALVPASSPRRLHHFMLQAKSIDDVGFALDRAEKYGTKIAQGLGRHTNDQMISFYAYTPAGFEVEFGFGAIEVDDATWRVTRHESTSSWGHKRIAQN